ncbi:hypothetical protein QTG54_015743 [Skeletonema marinoi]|uniref:Uncharacterized protein n=1 Tax=Skeletonema marinoi TaxID=267567 RepID=A0AAD8XUE2_9STRA|nr:hypothetical protein QTG54_015743 [Skeletonema marinoi]
MERPATAKERHDTGAKSIARQRPNDDDDDQQPAGFLKPTPAPTFTQPRPTLAKKSATGVADLQSSNSEQQADATCDAKEKVYIYIIIVG